MLSEMPVNLIKRYFARTQLIVYTIYTNFENVFQQLQIHLFLIQVLFHSTKIWLNHLNEYKFTLGVFNDSTFRVDSIF